MMSTSDTQDAIRKAAQTAGVDESAADHIAEELEKAGYQVAKKAAPTTLVTGEAKPEGQAAPAA